MTPAATKATFSDFKVVKTRRVCQLIFEVALEGADEALRALGGLPQVADERWCAIARLVSDKPSSIAPTPDKGRKSWIDLKCSAQAAIRCNEPGFWAFIGHISTKTAVSADDAAAFVRMRCGVESRSELDLNILAAEKWAALDTQYVSWQRGIE